MTAPIAQLRLVIDVRYFANGTSIEELKKRLRYVAEHAYGEGLLTGETEAEVDEHWFAVMETPEPLDEGEIADFMLERIENGSLRAEDLPQTLARYGLMETPDFVTEIRERIDNQAADSADGEDSHPATELTKHTFTGFVQANQDVISRLYADYLRLVVGSSNSDVDEFFMDHVSNLKDMLGSAAANNCSDDEAEQETAISLAEEWVTDNVSPSTEMCIAAVLYVLGVEKGEEEIRLQFK